jgi:MinD-like ATPase involved in chromosome partitioning or flagellar assembly
MAQHDDPYEGQHTAPPIPEPGNGNPPDRPTDQGLPPHQPNPPWSPWSSHQTPPAPDFSRAAFPPAMPAQADPRQWDRVDPPRPAPAQGFRPAAPPPARSAPTGSAPTARQHHHAPPAVTDGHYAPTDRHRTPAPVEQYASQTAAPHAQNPHDSRWSTTDSAWSTATAEREGPKQGWRAGAVKIGIKLPKSARELDYDRDVLRIRRKLAYPQNVLVIALKGGVGKSTSTILLGSTLAKHRHVSDVVAFDSATDGSLRRRMPVEQNRQVTSDARLFLRSLHQRAKLSQALSGSEVQVQLYSNSAGLQTLVAAQHLADYQLEEDEFAQILAALHNEYMVNLIDMGPDRRVSTFWPAIHSAHALVLVTTPNAVSIDAAKRFIDLLRDSHYKNLLTRTVLLWNNAAPGKDIVINVDATKNFLVRELSPQNDPSTCLIDIPLDPHLAAGGEVNLSLLRKDTKRQAERAAALLMDKLPDRAAAQHALLPSTEDKEL